jgi:hypothetical protein
MESLPDAPPLAVEALGRTYERTRARPRSPSMYSATAFASGSGVPSGSGGAASSASATRTASRYSSSSMLGSPAQRTPPSRPMTKHHVSPLLTFMFM